MVDWLTITAWLVCGCLIWRMTVVVQAMGEKLRQMGVLVREAAKTSTHADLLERRTRDRLLLRLVEKATHHSFDVLRLHATERTQEAALDTELAKAEVRGNQPIPPPPPDEEYCTAEEAMDDL
jgi:hypothetical protein